MYPVILIKIIYCINICEYIYINSKYIYCINICEFKYVLKLLYLYIVMELKRAYSLVWRLLLQAWGWRFDSCYQNYIHPHNILAISSFWVGQSVMSIRVGPGSNFSVWGPGPPLAHPKPNPLTSLGALGHAVWYCDGDRFIDFWEMFCFLQ